MYYLTFENDVFIDTDLDLKYLKKLLKKYLEKTDFFQVIALGEDKLIKKLLRDYAAYDEDGEYEEIFQGPTDDDFKKVILDNFLNKTKHRFLIILLNLIKCSQILILKGFEHFYCWKILHVSLYISSWIDCQKW